MTPGFWIRPLAFVFPWAVLFWAAFVWAFWPEFRIVREAQKSVKQGGSKDAGSCRAIVMGMNVAFLAAFPLAWVRTLHLSAGPERIAFAAGTLLLIGGSLLRRHCWRTLGASFTGDVRAHAGQRIVTAGAYRFLRHPSYTAGIGMTTGVGIALGSWASALLLGVASFVVYGYRISVEERALLEEVGEPYREFMRTRWRVIPFVY